MKLIRAVLSGLVLVLTPTLSHAQTAEPTIVIVVRHAERSGDPSGDPVLTEAGQARAQVLAEVLANA